MKSSFSPFPDLNSKRLSLKQIVNSDREKVFFLRTDSEVNKFIYRPSPHKTITEAEEFIEMITEGTENGKNVNWAIRFHDSDEMLGSLCLWNFSDDRKTAELGYDLNPEHHKKGIMSEAIKTVLNYGFQELKLDQIEAFTHRENEASVRLLIKSGFKHNENRSDSGNPNNAIYELRNPQ